MVRSLTLSLFPVANLSLWLHPIHVQMALKTQMTSLLQISLQALLPPKHLYLCGHQGLSVLTREAAVIPLHLFLLPCVIGTHGLNQWSQELGRYPG